MNRLFTLLSLLFYVSCGSQTGTQFSWSEANKSFILENSDSFAQLYRDHANKIFLVSEKKSALAAVDTLRVCLEEGHKVTSIEVAKKANCGCPDEQENFSLSYNDTLSTSNAPLHCYEGHFGSPVGGKPMSPNKNYTFTIKRESGNLELVL